MSETANFKLTVPLAGVTPVSLMFRDPPGGCYMVKITGVVQHTSEKEGGKTTLRFQTLITEDCEVRGLPMMVHLGTDFSRKDDKENKENFVLKLYVNLLTSLGIPLEALNTNIEVTPAYFIGKTAYVLVVPAPEGEVDERGKKKYANKNFVTREDYEMAKRAAAILTSNAPAANQPQVAANQPTAAQPRTAAAVAAPAPVPVPPGASAGVDLSSMFPG